VWSTAATTAWATASRHSRRSLPRDVASRGVAGLVSEGLEGEATDASACHARTRRRGAGGRVRRVSPSRNPRRPRPAPGEVTHTHGARRGGELPELMPTRGEAPAKTKVPFVPGRKEKLPRGGRPWVPASRLALATTVAAVVGAAWGVAIPCGGGPAPKPAPPQLSDRPPATRGLHYLNAYGLRGCARLQGRRVGSLVHGRGGGVGSATGRTLARDRYGRPGDRSLGLRQQLTVIADEICRPDATLNAHDGFRERSRDSRRQPART